MKERERHAHSALRGATQGGEATPPPNHRNDESWTSQVQRLKDAAERRETRPSADIQLSYTGGGGAALRGCVAGGCDTVSSGSSGGPTCCFMSASIEEGLTDCEGEAGTVGVLTECSRATNTDSHRNTVNVTWADGYGGGSAHRKFTALLLGLIVNRTPSLDSDHGVLLFLFGEYGSIVHIFKGNKKGAFSGANNAET